MITRKNFLLQSSVLAAGLAACPRKALSSTRPVGLQLYTLRDMFKDKTLAQVLQTISAAGYKEVEMFGLGADSKFFGNDAGATEDLLDEYNLKSPSGHYLPEDFLFNNGNGDDVKRICSVAKQIGNKYFVIPWIQPERRSTIEQYKALTDRLNKAGEICKAHGLQLAYHNHDFEFDMLNGDMGYNYIAAADPDLLKLEMDIYWVVRANQDPIAWFNKHPGRFHLWHVKDMSKTDKTLNAEVGAGQIDYPSIFAKANLAGLKHYIVEQETNYKPDLAGSIETSQKYVSGLLNM